MSFHSADHFTCPYLSFRVQEGLVGSRFGPLGQPVVRSLILDFFLQLRLRLVLLLMLAMVFLSRLVVMAQMADLGRTYILRKIACWMTAVKMVNVA